MNSENQPTNTTRPGSIASRFLQFAMNTNPSVSIPPTDIHPNHVHDLVNESMRNRERLRRQNILEAQRERQDSDDGMEIDYPFNSSTGTVAESPAPTIYPRPPNFSSENQDTTAPIRPYSFNSVNTDLMRPPDFSVLRQTTVHRDTPPLSPESRAGLMRRAMMLEQERIRLFTQRARETVGMRPTTSHLFDSTRNGNNGTLFAEYMANNNRAFGQRSLPGHELYAEMRLTNDRMRQINNQSFQTPRTYRPVTGRPAVGNPVASVHPSFRSKTVCSLGCQYCHIDICKRGMKAILLADTRVELYSTDSVTKGRVQLVGEDYITDNCQCKICDIACLGCGNVVGYHVTQACALCLQSCNNGHFWMFLSNTVKAEELKDDTGDNVLVWAHIPQVYKEESVSR